MPGDRESAWRRTVTVLVTVPLGVAGVAATLIAAGRLPCPVVCSPASTPTPVASSVPSTVDAQGPHVALDPTSGPAGTDPDTTIVLLTGGEVTTSPTYGQFQQDYQGLPDAVRRTPVFPLLFGENSEAEMTAVADLTGGKVFDARSVALADAFKEIRGYQ